MYIKKVKDKKDGKEYVTIENQLYEYSKQGDNGIIKQDEIICCKGLLKSLAKHNPSSKKIEVMIALR